jgi:hypothetical protein
MFKRLALFLSLPLICPAAPLSLMALDRAYEEPKEYEIFWHVTKMQDGLYRVSVSAPIEFNDFKFALFNELGDNEMGIYIIDKYRSNYFSKDSYIDVRVVPISQKKDDAKKSNEQKKEGR